MLYPSWKHLQSVHGGMAPLSRDSELHLFLEMLKLIWIFLFLSSLQYNESFCFVFNGSEFSTLSMSGFNFHTGSLNQRMLREMNTFNICRKCVREHPNLIKTGGWIFRINKEEENLSVHVVVLELVTSLEFYESFLSHISRIACSL